MPLPLIPLALGLGGLGGLISSAVAGQGDPFRGGQILTEGLRTLKFLDLPLNVGESIGASVRTVTNVSGGLASDIKGMADFTEGYKSSLVGGIIQDVPQTVFPEKIELPKVEMPEIKFDLPDFKAFEFPKLEGVSLPVPDVGSALPTGLLSFSPVAQAPTSGDGNSNLMPLLAIGLGLGLLAVSQK